jgi:hypothetical protein
MVPAVGRMRNPGAVVRACDPRRDRRLRARRAVQQEDRPQLRGDTTPPSWKAAREPGSLWSAQRVIVLVILLLILGLVIYLKLAGAV